MTRGSSFDDPAVQAGFAAAYDGDPWQDETAGPLEELGLAAEPRAADDASAAAEPDPDPDPDATAAAGWQRPAGPSARPRRAASPGALSPGRAVAGAAVAVGGVALGILSLLWVTGDPSPPGDVAARTTAPIVQTAPLETEQAPVDPPPVAVELPVPPPAAPVPPPVVPPPADPPVAAASPVVPVTVLNNSRTTGLADRAAQTFREGGWPVVETGNFTGRIRSSTVYYAVGQEESARAFADRFPGVERVLPRFDGLPGSGLTVVLTRDFA